MNVIEVNHLTKDYGSGRGVFVSTSASKKAKFSDFSDRTAPVNRRRFVT